MFVYFKADKVKESTIPKLLVELPSDTERQENTESSYIDNEGT